MHFLVTHAHAQSKKSIVWSADGANQLQVLLAGISGKYILVHQQSTRTQIIYLHRGCSGQVRIHQNQGHGIFGKNRTNHSSPEWRLLLIFYTASRRVIIVCSVEEERAGAYRPGVHSVAHRPIPGDSICQFAASTSPPAPAVSRAAPPAPSRPCNPPFHLPHCR